MSQRKPVYIIAEAGVNHNGDFPLAMEMITVAADAGADAVKFQTFKANAVVTCMAPKADYQNRTAPGSDTQFEMIRKFELGEEAHFRLLAQCNHLGIDFISSPFDLASIDLLARMGLRLLKIPSGEITNLPYLRKIAALGKKVILSTGMAVLDEIEAAVQILLEGGLSKPDITLLHCITDYPTPYEDVNLRTMATLMQAFPGIAIGYSDHSIGIEIPIAAVAMGATVLEKHFTMNTKMDGPDHHASLDPKHFARMVASIRNVERALGDGIKQPTRAERSNMAVVRKSIVAAGTIRKGQPFTPTNLTTKRPGTGLSPMVWDDVIGKIAERDYEADDFIWR
ncbi:MAG: hypothetical protein VR64_11595 [Desulfatitalea sp. BRH_c12]|nr:MAG: hypothetical protein VR64_11595 [Desulfatitalea sp. BRH_c12]